MEDNRRIFKFEGEPGEDFHLWAARTEAALEDKGAWSVVTTDVFGNTDAPPSEDVLKLVAKSRATIMQGLGNNPLRFCLQERSNPYKMWKVLQDRYAVVNVATKVQLQYQLSRLVYQNQKMTDFVDSFQSIFNKLAAMGSPIPEDMRVANLLASFGDKAKSPFGHVVAALQASDGTVSWDTATARLIQDYDEKAWSTGTTFPAKPAENAGSTVALNVHQRRKLADMSSGYRKRLRKSTLRCWECHEEGHKARDCPKKKRYSGKNQNAYFNDDSAHHATLLMAVATIPNFDKLLLDSGASDHMVMNRDYFVSLYPIEPRTIVLGNGATVTTRAKGDIQVKISLQNKYNEDVVRVITIRDVLFVPELAANLISCSTLCKNGYDIKFKGHRGRAMLNDFIEFQCKLDNGVYVITGVPNRGTSSAFAANTATEVLWHDRLGYADVGSIRDLARKEAVTGLELDKPLRQLNNSSDCIKGKQHKLSVRHKDVYSKQRGGVIHSDVSGIMSVPSLGGSRYYVSFIDEYSRYIVVIPIAKKSDVLEKLKHFHVWFERKYDCTIKKLHCDGGGEYVACDGYLQVHGIERDELPPYSPELNGMAERVNRTLMESARAMIYHANMPLEFWAEAVVSAADIRNRFTCPRSKGRTSYELLTGKKPRVDHLSVFGSMAWSHVPREKRKKLEPKSEECVVIGCFENSMYKVWMRNRQAPAMIRHIRVLENQFHPRSWYSSIDSGPPLTEEDARMDEPFRPQRLPQPNPTGSQTISHPENQHPSQSITGPVHNTEGNLENTEDLVTYIPPVPSRHGEDEESLDSNHDNSDNEMTIHDSSEHTSQEQGIIQHSHGKYPQRKRSAPDYYRPGSSFVAATANDPANLKEALSIESESEKWKQAIRSEMSSLQEHDVWKISEMPEGTKALETRFVFRRKMLHDGTVGRYKARLVVRGFMQGMVDQTYSPVVDFTTVRVALALAVQRNYQIHQMDVKTAFLHGDINGEIYVLPPEGAGIKLKPGQALKLRKGLYGLKQAPRIWYEKWNSVMTELGFSSCLADKCVYKFGAIWVLLYVDDVIVMGPTLAEVKDVKVRIAAKLDIKDLGCLNEFLGIKFSRDDYSAWLSQSHYVEQILNRFGMGNCKPVSTPACMSGKVEDDAKPVDQKKYQEMIGALLFLSTRTRPDISAAVGFVSRNCSCPTETDLVAVKRILRYLQGTKDLVLRLSTVPGSLVAYSDADWAGNVKDRKSTSGILLKLGDSTVSWRSRKQGCVSLSTSEAEFIALTEVCKEVIWVRKLLEEFEYGLNGSTTLFEDNHGAITWGREGIRNAKHVSIRVNFVQEQVKSGIVTLKYCATEDIVADILTKPLQRVRFQKLRDMLGVTTQNSNVQSKRGS